MNPSTDGSAGLLTPGLVRSPLPARSGHHPFRLLILCSVACLSLAGCAKIATVKEIKLSAQTGLKVNPDDPQSALSAHLAQTEHAWHELSGNPQNHEARRKYNFAVSRICGEIRSLKLQPWKAPVPIGSRSLHWKRDPRPEWNPALYELIPADQLQVRGTYVSERTIKEGLGAPLVAKRIAGKLIEYAPTPHFYYGVTAIARFHGTRCELAFEDPLKSETTRAAGHSFPLAADFTTPMAMMLVEMHPEKLGMARMLHPAKYASTTRIARLEPFDPNKTVVLVVHGLMSSPATWMPLINHLRGSEHVRRKYQFWFYSYPTGYPYAYSAALLRRELDLAEKRYPSRKKMVVIGHSMGGCISRLLITNAERQVWDQLFTVPPEKMEVSEEHRHILTESSIFNHRKEIGRVIFISAPLRGATLASGFLGRIGASLVKLPGDLVNLGRERGRYAKDVDGHRHLKRMPVSVDSLSPDNPFVCAINKVPIQKDVPYHVIAGDRGRGDAPKSSDGLVPYWSSYLPDAVSEKIVASHHNAQQHPDSYEEVLRILKLHTQDGKRTQ